MKLAMLIVFAVLVLGCGDESTTPSLTPMTMDPEQYETRDGRCDLAFLDVTFEPPDPYQACMYMQIANLGECRPRPNQPYYVYFVVDGPIHYEALWGPGLLVPSPYHKTGGWNNYRHCAFWGDPWEPYVPGEYHATLTLDPYNEIEESDEDNNVWEMDLVMPETPELWEY